jgi:hypothetical protein
VNLAALRARTRQLSGAELDDLRSNAEVDEVIRECYRQIAQLDTWRWREAIDDLETEADEPVYDLPAGVEEIRSVQALEVNGQSLPLPLQEVTLRDLLTLTRRDDPQLPRFYARFAVGKVRLGPVPDDAYTIEVYGQAPLTALDGDSDEPQWDERFHALIAYLAAAVILDEEGQDELAQRRRMRAEELTAEMVSFYQISKDKTPIQVGGGRVQAPRGRLGRLYPWR